MGILHGDSRSHFILFTHCFKFGYHRKNQLPLAFVERCDAVKAVTEIVEAPEPGDPQDLIEA